MYGADPGGSDVNGDSPVEYARGAGGSGEIGDRKSLFLCATMSGCVIIENTLEESNFKD